MFSNNVKALCAGISLLVAGCSDPAKYVVSGVAPETSGVDKNGDGFLAISDYQLMPLRTQDIEFLKAFQDSALSGATLPSGAVVPKGKDGLDWVAKNGELEFKKFDLPGYRTR